MADIPMAAGLVNERNLAIVRDVESVARELDFPRDVLASPFVGRIVHAGARDLIVDHRR